MNPNLHKTLERIACFLGLFFILSCGSTAAILSTPIENIDVLPLKAVELTDTEEKEWSHLDLKTDTIPGISLHKAYKELVKPKSKTVIVAVIDSGIDIDHEDLKDNIWVKRPGTGEILAEHYNEVLGKTAKKDIEKEKEKDNKNIERYIKKKVSPYSANSNNNYYTHTEKNNTNSSINQNNKKENQN